MRRFLGIAPVLLVLAAACSGATAPDLFSTLGADMQDGSTAIPSQDASIFDAPPTPTGKRDADTPRPDSGPPKSDAGLPDTGPPIDPDVGGIVCSRDASTYCDSATQVCCALRTPTGGLISYQCRNQGSCGSGQNLAVPCDDKDDCNAGDVCCTTYLSTGGGNGKYTRAFCESSAKCLGNVPGQANVTYIQLCESDAECVQSGHVCMDSSGLPGYRYCANP